MCFHHFQAAGQFETFRRQALALLARPQIRQVFDREREPAACRERYGRNRHGQAVLLARRLVEAGERFVTVCWGRELQDWAHGRGPRYANNPWDTHRNHFPLLRDELVPRADRALAPLVENLHQRSLLGEMLVVWMGDFGRTPRIDPRWASVSLADLTATIFRKLGVDPHRTIHDAQGRPFALSEREAIRALG